MSGSQPVDFAVHPNAARVPDDRRAQVLADPGFGHYFTDHMVTVTWTPESGWHDGQVRPYGPLSLDPATSVLHYAQEIFEGLKAYRHADGSIWAFRPEANAARFGRAMTAVAGHLLFAARQTEEVHSGALTVRNLVPAERQLQAEAKQRGMDAVVKRLGSVDLAGKTKWVFRC